MRIIGGEHRGRRIAAPPGRATRPMLDRVREAVFATLAPWLPGARVLDLFAGSGALGLEALSRGARHARFVERDERALGLLRDNVRTLRLEQRCTLVPGDALAPPSWRAADDEPFDVVFLDPPYPMILGEGADPVGFAGARRDAGDRGRVLGALAALVGGHLAPDGVVCLHVPRHALREADALPGLVVRRRDYGTNAILYAGADET